MKKILMVLGMMLCLGGLTACNEAKPSGSGEELSAEDQQLITDIEAMVTDFNMIVTGNLVEDAKAQYDMQGVPEMSATLDGWVAGMEEIGGYVATVEVIPIINEAEELQVNVVIEGNERNTEMSFYVSNKTNGIPQLTFTPVMSFGEKMVRAAQNTVLGMGTTFAILILISLIISCFGIIAKLQSKTDNKSKEETATIQAIDQTIAQIVAKEEMTDDSELIAVIAAAIAAGEGSAAVGGFRVRSIRKANTSKWKQA